MSQQSHPLTRDEAAAALDAAGRAGHSVTAAERNWPAIYLAAFGIAILVAFPMIGLVSRLGGLALWLAVVVVMASYARRQRVTSRGRGRVIGVSFAVWAVLYGAGICAGEFFFQGRAAFWLPMSLVVAAPLLVGAWWARRR